MLSSQSPLVTEAFCAHNAERGFERETMEFAQTKKSPFRILRGTYLPFYTSHVLTSTPLTWCCDDRYFEKCGTSFVLKFFYFLSSIRSFHAVTLSNA